MRTHFCFTLSALGTCCRGFFEGIVSFGSAAFPHMPLRLKPKHAGTGRATTCGIAAAARRNAKGSLIRTMELEGNVRVSLAINA
jgi:hypothetical protein